MQPITFFFKYVTYCKCHIRPNERWEVHCTDYFNWLTIIFNILNVKGSYLLTRAAVELLHKNMGRVERNDLRMEGRVRFFIDRFYLIGSRVIGFLVIWSFIIRSNWIPNPFERRFHNRYGPHGGWNHRHQTSGPSRRAAKISRIKPLFLEFGTISTTLLASILVHGRRRYTQH